MATLGNFWQQFKDLIPSEPKLVGTIAASYGNSLYRVDLVGGGSVQATSNTDRLIGDKVYITGKVIDGKAPDLPDVVIEI